MISPDIKFLIKYLIGIIAVTLCFFIAYHYKNNDITKGYTMGYMDAIAVNQSLDDMGLGEWCESVIDKIDNPETGIE